MVWFPSKSCPALNSFQYVGIVYQMWAADEANFRCSLMNAGYIVRTISSNQQVMVFFISPSMMVWIMYPFKILSFLKMIINRFDIAVLHHFRMNELVLLTPITLYYFRSTISRYKASTVKIFFPSSSNLVQVRCAKWGSSWLKLFSHKYRLKISIETINYFSWSWDTFSGMRCKSVSSAVPNKQLLFTNCLFLMYQFNNFDYFLEFFASTSSKSTTNFFKSVFSFLLTTLFEATF